MKDFIMEDFIKAAAENRRKVLTTFEKEFLEAKTAKAKARVVIEAIKLEPSHLLELWILLEVVNWLRD